MALTLKGYCHPLDRGKSKWRTVTRLLRLAHGLRIIFRPVRYRDLLFVCVCVLLVPVPVVLSTSAQPTACPSVYNMCVCVYNMCVCIYIYMYALRPKQSSSIHANFNNRSPGPRRLVYTLSLVSCTASNTIRTSRRPPPAIRRSVSHRIFYCFPHCNTVFILFIPKIPRTIASSFRAFRFYSTFCTDSIYKLQSVFFYFPFREKQNIERIRFEKKISHIYFFFIERYDWM